MKRISVSDMTLVNFAPSLSFKEKTEIARHLDNLRTDYIHIPQIENVKTDALLIRTVSAFVKNSAICVTVAPSREGVEIASAALSGAKKSRLSVNIPVSPIQMEYIHHKKAPKMLALAKELFAAACEKCDDVEFFAADATRADMGFLCDAVNAAIEAGVKTVTLCDDEGAMLPDEISAFLASVKENVPSLEKVNLGVLCRNTLGMAAASAVMALKTEGVCEIKCCVGVGDIPELDTFAGIVGSCGDRCGFSAGLNYNELHRITKQIEWICGSSEQSGSPASLSYDTKNTSDSENETPLDANDTPDIVRSAVSRLGYDLSDEDNALVYDEFLRVAEKKKITSKDLDAIVASVALQAQPTYKLVSYVVNNGNIISSSAQIKLEKDGSEISGICMGDGPIDAAFRTVEQIIGHHFELDEFRIHAVTEGKEAVGSAVVRLRSEGKLYSGNGISTDIIGASIRAYINAVNKIVSDTTSNA